MRLNKITLIIITFLILISILHFLRWPFFTGKVFLPFRAAFSFFEQKISSILDPIFIKKNLIEENARLKNENVRLILRNIEVKMVEEENEKLREELNFIKKINYRSVLANVIGRKDEVGISWFIIDRGSQDGLKEGLVVVSNGVVVGKVIRVMKNISYVLPLFNDKVRLAVKIVTSSGSDRGIDIIEGLAKGKSGLAVEVDLIPIDKEIVVGDWVLTSGLEYNIPRGFFIGSLKEIKGKATDLFYKVIVEVPQKLESLDMVNIIIPRIE